MTYKTITQLKSEVTTNFADNSAGAIGADDARSILTNLIDSMPNIRTFQASDLTGATDITSELTTLVTAAAGAAVYIPGGTYQMRNFAVSGDVNVICSPDAKFVNPTGDYRAIYQRGDSDAEAAQSISAMSEVTYFFKEKVLRLTVTDASLFAKGDVVHLISDDGYLLSGDNRILGFAAKVLAVDTVNEYLYLDRRSRLSTLMATTPVVRKMSSRKFSWIGGTFQAYGNDDDVSIGADVSDRRPCIEIIGQHHVKLHFIETTDPWHTSILLRGCPFSDIFAPRFRKMHNLLTTDTSSAASITAITKAAPGVLTITPEHTGTATAGASSTITLEGTASASNSAYTSNMTITITSGTGSGQVKTVSSYNGTTKVLTVSGTWSVTPDATSVYTISKLKDGQDLVMWNIGGMTELNSRPFRVISKSGNTFQLQDYYGVGSGSLDTTSFTTYTSGGSAAWADVNALGYGVSFYGACCSSVLNGALAEEGRHGVFTTDGWNSSYTWPFSNWAWGGQPHYLTITNCVSNGSYGIPFDTHEEGVGIVITNCVSIFSNRGPEGGSYYGAAFQLRSIDTTVTNCTVIGGTWGIRLSQNDYPLRSKDIITGCVFRDIQGASDGEGYAITFAPEDSTVTYVSDVHISKCTFLDCGTGINVDSNYTGFTVTLGSGIDFIGCEEAIDLHAGGTLVALDRVNFDFTQSKYTSAHYAVRCRSSSGNKPKAIFLGGATLRHSVTHFVTSFFEEVDTTDTKYYYMPTGGFVQEIPYQYTFTDADVNTGTDVLTVTSHGYSNGTPVKVRTETGTMPSGLSASTIYYARSTGTNTITLHTSYAGATGGSGLVDITATGTGTFYIGKIADLLEASSTTFLPYGDVTVI